MMHMDAPRRSDDEVMGEASMRKALAARAERRLDDKLLAAASLDVDGARLWFAVQSDHRSEVDLCRTLTDSRVDAVVPVKQVHPARRVGCRGGKVVHKPVLAGLVFVNLVPSDEAFAGLGRVRGVRSVIGARGRPMPIMDREMNGFMDLAQAGAFDERHMARGIKVGARVRINVGPYADFQGILEGYAKGRTARVRTWLFGGEMVVPVTLAHIEVSE